MTTLFSYCYSKVRTTADLIWLRHSAAKIHAHFHTRFRIKPDRRMYGEVRASETQKSMSLC